MTTFLHSQKTKKIATTALMLILVAVFVFSAICPTAHAVGLVDDTIDAANEYSKYSLDNYQLDFYVDKSWDWLPWNWADGIGKSVHYGLYSITNFIWTINLYISNATGYLVQEAYSLDFISSTADAIGQNMQILAGVSPNGISTDGFYFGFLMLLIAIIGIYVVYIGLIKRETTKAIKAILNFVVIFALSAGFIAYAPSLISKVNEFSSDVSNACLSLGTKMIMPENDTADRESVDIIRDNLFAVQVQQPWLLLQFGNSDIAEIGADRIEALLSINPNTNKGEDREEVVKNEIEERENTNLTLTQTINRLGMSFVLLLLNIVISIFVLLLCAIMILSQILFIMFCIFLVASFIMSMIPGFEGTAKKAIIRLFNTIMTRAGITLITTVAFSLSTMFYKLSATEPFFLIAFLQIITFAGIFSKLGDLMSSFSLESNDVQGMGSRMFRKPRMFMHRQLRKLGRTAGRTAGAFGAGAVVGGVAGGVAAKKGARFFSRKNENRTRTNKSSSAHSENTVPNTDKQDTTFSKRAGQKVGDILDTKNRVVHAVGRTKEQIKDLPTNAKYAVHSGKTHISNGVRDFTRSTTRAKAINRRDRRQEMDGRRQTIAERRNAMDMARQKKHSSELTKNQPHVRERPVSATIKQRESEKKQQQNIRPTTNIPMKQPAKPDVSNEKTVRPVVKSDVPVNRKVILNGKPVDLNAFDGKKTEAKKQQFTKKSVVKKKKGDKP